MMTTPLTHRPQWRSRTIGRDSDSGSGSIDGGLLQRALFDTPALQNLEVGAVGYQLAQRPVHRIPQRGVGLGEADAVRSAFDRRARHDLECVAVARGSGDGHGARPGVEKARRTPRAALT